MMKFLLLLLLLAAAFLLLPTLALADEPGGEPPVCPAGTHWDSNLEECVSDAAPAPSTPGACKLGEHWDDGMKMCMADQGLMFHYNQFLVYTGAQGPRGREAFTAPNMWMLTVNRRVNDKNFVGLEVMGDTDLWLVPGHGGTPQIGQVGEVDRYKQPVIDGQHPHSTPVMGLTFSDILAIGKNGEHRLTFFFAPRGEATAGPQAYMHRASSEGNPDTPLSHHLQDVFHITSTVAGAKLQVGKKTTVEGSVFSGWEPDPSVINLDVHKPDSFGVRTNHQLTSHVGVGGSYAKVRATEHEDGLPVIEHRQAFSAWAMTNYLIGSGVLDTSSIWGAVCSREARMTLNSFLEEFVYRLGKNGFYGRLEVLQRTPGQLDLVLTDGATGAKWLRTETMGYERELLKRDGFKLYGGSAVTKNHLPTEFQPAYSGNPWGGKAYLRINWGK